ncbi:hypothetical protein BCON_0104g00400 [Botryotinia convoluta]|uniref:Uncharacterized protein n=1 Tax=Botryotinia convoluta TaxID=54673 RepID=A0A4Z1ICW6_9HELO|nr:hypothetical protein BCON_0104g00400 [Botryotinia convoluta]
MEEASRTVYVGLSRSSAISTSPVLARFWRRNTVPIIRIDIAKGECETKAFQKLQLFGFWKCTCVG